MNENNNSVTQYGQMPSLPNVDGIDYNKISRIRSSQPDYIKTAGRDPFSSLGLATGVWWLGGFFAGGGYGVAKGWKSAANSNYKVRMNNVMNSFSKVGSIAGNTAGVLAFFHSSSVLLLKSFQVERYVDTPVTIPFLSGAITGGLYMSARGARAVAGASVAGGIVSCVYMLGGSFLYNQVLGRGGRF